MGSEMCIRDSFLHWMLGPGQKMTEALFYAPLPQRVAAKEMKAIAGIQ